MEMDETKYSCFSKVTDLGEGKTLPLKFKVCSSGESAAH